MKPDKDKYPPYFIAWNKFLDSGGKAGYYDQDEFIDIIEIYLKEDQIIKLQKTVAHAMTLYLEDSDFVSEVLILLNDYELWNDLLEYTTKLATSEHKDVWTDGHRLTALLHLGMEEEAFFLFQKMKKKYESVEGRIIYQAMSEALMDMDLFDSAIDVVKEAVLIYGDDLEFMWLSLHCYYALGNKNESLFLAERIEKKDPLDAESWYKLGLIYYDIHECDRAIDAFENAQSLGYEIQKVLINLMSAYEKNENYLKVLEKAKEYLVIFPESYIIQVAAAKAASQMDMWDVAQEYTNRAISLMPEQDTLYLYQSSLYAASGEMSKAKMILEKGIEITQDPYGVLRKELDRMAREEGTGDCEGKNK